jgi:hypothetical protein
VTSEDAGWHGAHPQLARTEEARGSNPLTSTPNLAGQSVASVKQAALTAGRGRSAAASASRSPARKAHSDQRLGPGPHTMTTERSRHLATHPGSSTNGRSSRASGLSWSATRSTLPVPITSHDDGRVQADASTGPARPAPASIAWFRLGQMTSRSWTRRATTPTPAIPAIRPAPPPPSTTSLQADTADAGTHGHRTPTLDTGPPDTWTLRRPHQTLGTGRVDRHAWTLDTGTGHWTLAEDADTVTKARSASDLLGYHVSGCALGHPTGFLWTALRRLATMTARRWAACSVAPPAKPRLGALLSSNQMGGE